MKKRNLLAIFAALLIGAQGAAIGFAEAPTLSVDGVKVDAEIISHDEMSMLPLRVLAENTGFEVSWNATEGFATIKKDGEEIVVKPNMARTTDYIAKIHNDRTYVTLDFLNDSMGLAYETDAEGNINVFSGVVEEPSLIRKVTVNSISEDGISVNDEIIGEVILKVAEETQITKNGEKAELAEIKEESVLMVEYSPAMTMSLPPQALAVSIEIVTEESTEEAEESVTYEGEIAEITEDGLVIVKNENDPYGVALKITENTQISHHMNRRLYKAEDLKKGMKVSVTHSNIATKSLPPQSEAFAIVIK